MNSIMKIVVIAALICVSVNALDLGTTYFQVDRFATSDCSGVSIKKECYAQNACYAFYGVKATGLNWVFWSVSADNAAQTATMKVFSDKDCTNQINVLPGSNQFPYGNGECNLQPFDKGNTPQERFKFSTCGPPSRGPGALPTTPIGQVEYANSGCSGGIAEGKYPRTNMCVERTIDPLNGNAPSAVWIEWLTGDTKITENHYADLDCTGTVTKAPVYNFTQCVVDEKWFTNLYATPDSPASGVPVGVNIFPNSAFTNAAANGLLVIVVSALAILLQKF
jgi:hypothetical protein